MDPARAAAAARRLIADGCSALLSFGMAGGLDPALGPGTVVLAGSVLAPGGETYGCDEAWRAALGARIPAPSVTLLGRDAPVCEAADKARLFAETGAAIVDMESHAVAAVAAESGVSFLALRAVADAAHRAVPRSALSGVGPDGATRPGKVLAALIRAPWEVVPLVGLALDSRRALAALRRVALLGDPCFAFR
jgi:hopanoid-associated phosphorylase